MKKTLKCVLFLTLVVLALFAVTMLGASAATYDSDADAIAAGDVVKVEYTKDSTATTEYYASISAAIEGMGDAIADGATVTVLDDIAVEDAATISAGNVTVIGNNFTATGLALTISGGTVTLDGLNIVNTTAGVNTITVSGNAVIEISNATIQGANAAIWVSAQVKTPIKITNCTVKAVVQDASKDYGFAFYVASNVGLNATNSTFALEFADGVTGCKGKGVFRNDGRCPREASTDYSWTLGNCTITSALNNQAFFAVNKDLQIYAGEGGLTITRSVANAAADLFNVAASATLTLNGTETAPIKLSQTASGYYGGPVRLAGGAKVVMNYVEASGSRRVVYAPAAGTVTVQATNSKLSTTLGDKWNGIVYFEPGASKTIALNMTLTSCDVQAQGYLVAFSSASNTATANITVDDTTTITFAKTNGAQLFRANTSTVTTITMNGGNYTSSYGSIVMDRANQSLTMNNVNFKGGTYGIVRVGAAGATVTINGGNYSSASTTWPLFDIRYSATVTINGGYFECKDDVMFNVGPATLDIYGGYFHRVGKETDAATFVSAGSSYGAGTANIWGGTFVADYTDAGSVFTTYDIDSVLNYYSFNGMGSAVVIVDYSGETVMENEESFSFWYNSIKVFNSASLRLNADGDVAKSGLRFTSYITKAYIDMIASLADADTDVAYGTVVVPAKYLENVNYFSVEAVSNALVIPATETGMLEDAEGGKFIRASIYNLPRASEEEGNTTEMMYNDEYAVIVYAEYTKDGKAVRNYSNFDASVHCADAASLANDALKDVSEVQTGAYVNPVVVNDTIMYSKYTENELIVITTYAADYVDAVKVNGKIYGSFEKALEKAGEGDTIYLLKDLTLEGAITVAQNVVIDGQGYTVTMPAEANAHVFVIAEGADLTVTNLNAVNEGTAAWKNSIFTFTGVATLTVDGGEYSAAAVVLYGESCGASTVTLNTPTFTTLNANSGNAAPILVNAAMTLNINGGTYTTNEKTSTGNALRILNADATVTIDGATFDSTADGAYAIFVKEDTKEVLIGEESAIFVNSDAIEYYGTYQAFEVNGEKYNSWTDAIDAVEEGGTITLLKSFDATAAMVVNKNITLDGNGYTITDAKSSTHTFTFSGYDFTVTNLNVVSTGKGDWNDAIFYATGTSSLTVNGGVYTAYQMVIQCNNTSSYTTITVNDAEFITTRIYTGSSKNFAPIMVDGKGDVITINGGTFTSGNKTSGACIRANANTTLVVTGEVTFNAYAEAQSYDGVYGVYFTGTPTTAPEGLENITFNVVE